MKRITIGAMALGLALAISGCGGSGGTSDPKASADVLKLGVVAAPASLDAAGIQEGQSILFAQALYDSLLIVDSNGELQPNVATEWSYSDDQLELTLKIRDDVTFSDGTKLDAQGVVAGLQHIQKGTSTGAQQLAGVKKFEAVDDATVKLTLGAPNPGLLYSLATYGGFLVSPKAVDDPETATKPVGSGPYVLDTEATVEGTRYVFKRNTDYWNDDAFPYDNFELLPFAENTARLNALKTGQIDGMWGTPELTKDVEASGLTVNRGKPIDWTGLFLSDRNGVIAPALGDVRVRQAINYAIDRQKIADTIYSGEAIATTQVFNPASAAWSDELNDAYPFDPDKARSLIKEADAEGAKIKLGSFAGFAIADAIEQQLKDVGLKVEVEVVPATADAFAKLLANPMFFMNMGTNISPWIDLVNVATPNAVMNPLKSQTPEFDKLLANIQSTTGDEQTAAYQAANKYLVDQAWYAPVVATNGLYFTASDVHVDMQPAQVVPSLRNFSPAS